MSLQFRVLGNRISRTGTGSQMGKIFLFGTVLLLTWFPAKSFSPSLVVVETTHRSVDELGLCQPVFVFWSH